MRLSPDGHRYLAKRPPRPFVWRWLWPALTGRDALTWEWSTRLFLPLLAAAAWAWSGDWRVPLFLAGFAGVVHINVRFPVLVDVPAMTFALSTAAMVEHRMWWAAVPCALLAGATCEKAPAFAALFAWSPLPLLGLVAVGWWRKPGPDMLTGEAAEALRTPFAASWRAHRALPLWVWVLPWGAGLAALAAPTLQLWATLAVAYALTIVATDTVRLYQWAWPVVAVCALAAIPPVWLPLALVVHAVNPFRTEGV